MRLTLSLGQMQVHFGDPAANLAQVAEWLAEAARLGSQLLLLPELWSSGLDLPHARRYATALGEGLFAQISALGRQHRVAVAGTTLELWQDRVYNTFTLHDAEGNCRAVYRKTHLFTPSDEGRYLTPGDQLAVAQTDWGPVGLGICYELRFPEIFRYSALRGAPLVLLPAAWPASREAHWRTLLRARAIENQMFVAACNCVGDSHAETYAGASALLDPWGTPLVEGSDQPALLTAALDLTQVETVRQRLPALPDRRPDIYG